MCKIYLLLPEKLGETFKGNLYFETRSTLSEQPVISLIRNLSSSLKRSGVSYMVENGRWSVSYLWGTILIFGLPHISFLQSYNLQGFIKGPAQYKSNRVHPWPRFPRVPTNLSSFTFPDLHSETVRGSPFLPSGGHIYCPRYFLSEDMISRNSGQVNYFWQFRSICEGWYFKGFALNCPKSIFVSKSLMKSIFPQGNFGNLKSILTCCWLIEER